MAESQDTKPEHIEAEKYKKTPPTENPLARGLNVTVSIPETVEIRMVDASALADYEVWFFISSVLGSAVVGFLVAYLQSSGDSGSGTFLANTLVFSILFVTAITMTLFKRHKLRKRAKDIKLRATEVSATDTNAF